MPFPNNSKIWCKVGKTTILSLILGMSTHAQAQETLPPQASDETVELGAGVRSLEEQVNALKEKVFKSKARLILLRETVLDGVISSARAIITHRNDMGSSFRLIEMSYSLDGEILFSKTMEKEDKNSGEETELFNGSLPAGTHNLSVLLVYRGHGYGVFTYLDAYKFKLKASYPFTAEEGKQIVVNTVAFEKGGLTTELHRRPMVRFDTSITEGQSAPSAAQASSEKPES